MVNPIDVPTATYQGTVKARWLGVSEQGKAMQKWADRERIPVNVNWLAGYPDIIVEGEEHFVVAVTAFWQDAHKTPPIDWPT